MSLGIQLESGNFLTLNTNSRIKFTLKSTLFNERIEANSRSFVFKGPAEPNNIHFQFANELNVRNRVLVYRVRVYLLGLFWKNALLEITDFNEVEYTFRLLIDRGYNALDSNKSLRDFNYLNGNKKQLRFVNNQLPRTSYSFDASALLSPCTVTIDFFRTYATGTGQNIVKTWAYDPANDTEAELVSEIVNWFNDRMFDYHYYLVQGDAPFNNEFTIYNLTNNTGSGFYFTITATDPNFNIANLSGNVNVDVNTAYQRLVADAINNERDYIAVMVAAPQLYTIDNTNYWKYQNPILPTLTGNPLLNGQLATSEQPVSPFPYLKPVLYNIIDELGCTIVRDDFFDSELSKLLLYNHEAINEFRRTTKNGWRYRFTGAFYYNDIVPDLPVNVFLNDLRLYFNLLVDFDSRSNTVKVIRVDNLLDELPEDWTEYLLKKWDYRQDPLPYGLFYTWVEEPLSTELLPVYEKTQQGPDVNFKSNLPATPVNGFFIQKAIKENKLYKYDTAWQLYAEDFYPVNQDAPRKMQTGASPLFTIQFPYVKPAAIWPHDIKWLLPYTKQPGNLTEYDKVQSPHRYMIYRGMRPCSVKVNAVDESYLAATYPFASSHNYDYNGNKIGEYSLAWNAEDGVYNKFWKRWINYLKNSSPIMMEFKLPIDKLLNLDITRKKYIAGIEYFIDECDFEIDTELSTIRCKMYPIYKTHE
jgi:hypothetical protein